MARIPDRMASTPVQGVKTWTLGECPWISSEERFEPSARVIIDNDFAGDPDDLWQLVHHLLSPSVEIPLVVASHLREDDPFDPSGESAKNAEAVAREVFSLMGLLDFDRIVRGSNEAMPDTQTPQDSGAARAIIKEAMRDDTDLPLFYAAGGGLTDLASALLLEPKIAERIRLIWIGGLEHSGLAYPPANAMPIEYNMLIDVPAARAVFDCEDLEIWQIPRNMYRQCLVSHAELRARTRDCGRLGDYLYDSLIYETRRVEDFIGGATETYALGDQPLVLFTALRSLFEADTSSSDFVLKVTPQVTADGTYRMRDKGRLMRVYTRIDTRTMFEDMFLKINEFVDWSESDQL